MTNPISILSGVYELADEWLDLHFSAKGPLYQHKTAALDVCNRSHVASAGGFLRKAYEQVDQNWRNAVASGRYSHSSQNWRFTQRPDISRDNTSPEVILERAIICVADDYWANRVPTSSGLVGSRSDKLRNVDLVQRNSDGNFTLIELKVDSNNPLFAAVEILTYGLLLAWSKNNTLALSYDTSIQPILSARSIQLCVLAPDTYYRAYELGNLQNAICDGPSECADIFRLPYFFVFTKFAQGFDPVGPSNELLAAAKNRELVVERA